MSLKQIAVAFDQLVNALLGGYADETLSARAHRTQSPLERYINAMFFWQVAHCFESYISEKERKQLPGAYQ